MARLKLAALAGAALTAALTLTAAQQPSALAQTQGGLWEISGLPWAKAPVKQCVADVATLAQIEHRGKGCSAKVISSNASSTVISYDCGAGGFGRSKVDLLTPRSLRIETQGISEQLPFRYVLQARRVGDCPTHASAARH